MKEKKKKFKFNFKEFMLINLGILLTSIGIYFFKMPNGFSTGGVSGLSIILGKVIDFITPATMMAIMNVLLLIIGFIFVNGDFGLKTVYATIMFSLETWLLELILPLPTPLTNEPFMELCLAILLTAVGSAILFNCSASSGGTDIIAMILKKYTSINVGTALLISNAFIAFASFLVFDISIGLFSVLGLFAQSFLVDGVIENLNLCKYFTIITDKPDEICEYIMKNLHRGVTKQEAIGEYTKNSKYILLTVVSRTQAVKLRNKTKDVDPESFVMITNTSEIVGKGFGGIN